jgi:integrase
MPRQPKPWFRKSHGTYFATIRGRVTNLGTAVRQAAFDKFHSLMAAAAKPAVQHHAELPFARLALDYLRWAEANRRPSTVDEQRRYIVAFAKFVGGLRPAESIIPNDLTNFLSECAAGRIKPTAKPVTVATDGSGVAQAEPTPNVSGNRKPFGQGGRRAAITAIKRCFNWGIAEGLIGRNPVARFKAPRVGRRQLFLTAEQQTELLAAIPDGPFKTYIEVAIETGMRPQEAKLLAARHIDGSLAVFPVAENKTGEKTGKPRVVFLTDRALELLRPLAEKYPDGPILRNHKGRPWHRHAINSRMRRLVAAGVLPAGACNYTLRHSFATEALRAGVHPEELRHLLGQSSLAMIVSHYSHLDQHKGHLVAAAERARAGVRTAIIAFLERL